MQVHGKNNILAQKSTRRNNDDILKRYEAKRKISSYMLKEVKMLSWGLSRSVLKEVTSLLTSAERKR